MQFKNVIVMSAEIGG